MGGPSRYTESCGDQSFVLQMHAGNGDLTDLSRRFVECFVRAADDAGLPEDAEFRTALRDYMQWAVGGGRVRVLPGRGCPGADRLARAALVVGRPPETRPGQPALGLRGQHREVEPWAYGA